MAGPEDKVDSKPRLSYASAAKNSSSPKHSDSEEPEAAGTAPAPAQATKKDADDTNGRLVHGSMWPVKWSKLAGISTAAASNAPSSAASLGSASAFSSIVGTPAGDSNGSSGQRTALGSAGKTTRATGPEEYGVHFQLTAPITRNLLSMTEQHADAMRAQAGPPSTAGCIATRARPRGQAQDPVVHVFGLACDLHHVPQEEDTEEDLTFVLRLSLVDEQLRVLYDSFVAVPPDAANYADSFPSTYRAAARSGQTCTLDEARDAVLDSLRKDDIIVGARVHDCLRALKITHRLALDAEAVLVKDAVEKQASTSHVATRALKLTLGAARTYSSLPSQDVVEQPVATDDVEKAASTNGDSSAADKYRTVPCMFFARGFCKRGAKCTYLHDSQRTEQEVKEIWQEYKEDLRRQGCLKTKVCAHYLRGFCYKGGMCTYRHDPQQGAVSQKMRLSSFPGGVPPLQAVGPPGVGQFSHLAGAPPAQADLFPGNGYTGLAMHPSGTMYAVEHYPGTPEYSPYVAYSPVYGPPLVHVSPVAYSQEHSSTSVTSESPNSAHSAPGRSVRTPSPLRLPASASQTDTHSSS